METTTRPQLAAARHPDLELVRNASGGFDLDAYHAMDERDNVLVVDALLNGAGSSSFIYSLTIGGQQLDGISVVGARHLAAHYKGLKHRIVGSVQKTGSLLTFTTYPHDTAPMAIHCSTVEELAPEPDFYSCVVEMIDIKTGNALMIERRELRYETRRDGSQFERPHYATIAQSKAFRNAVLSIVPQDFLIRWKQEMLKLKKGETITASVLDEKRRGILRFAAARGIAVERRAIEHLSIDQIAGLSSAAQDGRISVFANAASVLGLIAGSASMPPDEPPDLEAPPRRRGRPPGRASEPPASTMPDDEGAPSTAPEPPADDIPIRRPDFEFGA